MACIIGTIGMRITRISTLMARSDDIRTNGFSQPFIENEILSNKFIFESFFFTLSCIFDDSSIHHIHLFESFMEVISTHTTVRSEEHTSELQSRGHLVCRLLL